MDTSLKNFILDLARKGMRIDERNLDELREVKVSCGVSKNAEGSARVKLGKTEVMVGVKMDVGEPFADRPDEGILIVNAELSPLASPEFEPGPPGEEAIELARVVDRGIRGANMIDLKKLFIEEGKVWCVFVDIYIINHDGNLMDAAALGAVSALKDARLPKLEEGRVVYGEKSKKKLPITCVPTSLTAVKIGNYLLPDPCKDEEKVADARLTVSVSDKEIHAMQKGGEGVLSQEEILKIVDMAFKHRKSLLKAMS